MGAVGVMCEVVVSRGSSSDEQPGLQSGSLPSDFFDAPGELQLAGRLGPFGDDGGTGVGALFAGGGAAASGLAGWGDEDEVRERRLSRERRGCGMWVFSSNVGKSPTKSIERLHFVAEK